MTTTTSPNTVPFGPQTLAVDKQKSILFPIVA